MRTRMVAIVLAALVAGIAGAPQPADALCTCGDRDGCSSAAVCVGKSPGDTCSPPRNSTCKIVVGTGNDLNCCCGCSRGPGPISCVLGPVADALEAARVPAETCPSERAHTIADKTTDRAADKLRGGEKKCKAKKPATKQVNSAKKGLRGLRGKLDKLERRGKIAEGCADAYGDLADGFLEEIDDAQNGGTGGGGTTTSTTTAGTTTTSTTAAPFQCAGQLQNVVGFPDELDMWIQCATGGPFTVFGVHFPGRQITNQLFPDGFDCQITDFQGGTDNYFWCSGPFANAPFDAGRVHLVPPPVPGMGAGLFVGMNGTTYGPFQMTGPP